MTADKMRVLIVGDAAVSSGFARCTHALADALYTAGHEPVILGINYFGDPHEHPYKIFPCKQPFDGGKDLYGVCRLPLLMERLEPDVVVLLNDPWNIPAYFQAIDAFQFTKGQGSVPVVGWLAVDGENNRAEGLERMKHCVVWTQYAEKQLRRAGLEVPMSVVPLGVDLNTFSPRDRALARGYAMPPAQDLGDGTKTVPAEQAFVVGYVGRNQPRKRLDLLIEYFADWVKRYNIRDAQLYLHVAPTGERGCDIQKLIEYHGLSGMVILAQTGLGYGIEDDKMPLVYSSFDVCVTTTQGEGWGLTTMEAMACGVPCIVPKWSALGEWTEEAAVKILCSSHASTAPAAHPYVIGGIADKYDFVDALHTMYTNPELRAACSSRGLNLVRQERFSWSNIGDRVSEILQRVVAEDKEQEAKDWDAASRLIDPLIAAGAAVNGQERQLIVDLVRRGEAEHAADLVQQTIALVERQRQEAAVG